MKTITLAAIVFSLTQVAFAQSFPKNCLKAAEKAVEKATKGQHYDKDGFSDNSSCLMASNKAVVVCEVYASKGGGDAYDTYRAVLNKTCTKTFRVELTGDE